MTWQFAKVKNKVFVYKNGSMTPVFTFERKTENTPYAGHGKRFQSQIAIEKWVEKEGEAILFQQTAAVSQ